MHPTLRPDDFMERAMSAWGGAVYRLALSQTGSAHDAEDICQDVFLRLLKDATAFEDDEHLKAWLLHVTANRCRDLHRSAWRRHAELVEAMPDTCAAFDADEDAGARALRESRVGRAMEKLPAKTRLIVHLRYCEGYSAEEIARIVRCLPATVRSRLRRARGQIKALLEEEASREQE
ncbi:RNA polymerase sigma factor [Arabiibacter massiliensis]|uniref:RNA polymerase sigma factor n=1 Tax=Arabiibacter massiliensis TaxID=1870985 RepID=UPI0009BB71CB|nr:RNA polymerase sigma factor [Arabiibacter massiliensis]